MQDITPILKPGKKQIEAYGGGGFKVAGQRIEGNIIILPDSVHSHNADSIENFSDKDIESIITNADDIEILLVGGGASTNFFSDEIERLIKSKSISVEYMDTGAAARTYNILLTEERKVAAILIAV